MYRGMHMQGRPVVLPESAVTLSEFQNGVYKYKGTVRCFARLLCFVKVYQLDHLDMLYRGISTYCSL